MKVSSEFLEQQNEEIKVSGIKLYHCPKCHPEKFHKGSNIMEKITKSKMTPKDELFKKYEEINHKLLEIRKQSQFPDKDGRKDVFGQLRNIIMFGQVIFHIMHAMDTKKIPEQVFKDVFGLGYEGEPEKIFWRDTFSTIPKLAIASHSNFMIESFFKSLLKELEIEIKPNTGYYKIMNEVLIKSEIKDSQRMKDAFNVLAQLRNSFHNNGVFVPVAPTPDKMSKTIDGIKYEFEKGEQTKITWMTLGILFNKIVDHLHEIVNSQKITELKKTDTSYIPK
jgi:hypothetical protein